MKNLTINEVILKMKNTFQTEEESVWNHGRSVRFQLKKILKYLKGESLSGKDIPPWLTTENFQGLVIPPHILRHALFHDAGKPFCKPDS